MQFDIFQALGTDYAQQKQLERLIESKPNIFVGWIDSFDETNGTANIQPAIQDKIIDSNNLIQYKNKPYLINVWVCGNTLARKPQKGDKALVFVLDEKSNNFFKVTFDNTKNIKDQTFTNNSKTNKDISNTVAIVINKDPSATADINALDINTGEGDISILPDGTNYSSISISNESVISYADGTQKEISSNLNLPFYSGKGIMFRLTNSGRNLEISANVLAIYPVGAIYLSVSNTSPAALFGGTWEQLAANNTLWTIPTTDNTGGGTISAGLPNITGEITGACYSGSPISGAFATTLTGECKLGTSGGSVVKYNNFNASRCSSVYSDTVDTVQPPAIKVYAWKRIA